MGCMYLKEVRLENFKSFKRCRIPFLPGFTSITGPNGSGKSNIADAILFVLCPKSSKVMRAGRLTDLIFNGGKRGADFCKVSLTFDNSDKELPLGDKEVMLTRKIRRAPLKGDPENYYSYFYINGRASSFSDFSFLLAEAKINGYNIIQQGDVMNIVEMGRVDRRQIIDGIAGIAEFDKDIEKAEREKAVIDENLDRASIILEEIKRELKQLKKDRNGALRYKKLEEELTAIKGKIALKKKSELEKEMGELLKQIDSYQSDKEFLEGEIENLKNDYEEKEGEMRSLGQMITERSGDEIREDIEKKKMDKIKLEEKMKYFKKESSRLKADKEEMEKELSKIRKNLEKEFENKKFFEEKILQKKMEFEKEEKELSKIKGAIANSDEKERKMREEYECLSEKMHLIWLEKDRIDREIDGLATRINELRGTSKAYEFEIEKIDGRLRKKEELESKISALREKEENISSHLFNLEREIIHLRDSLSINKYSGGVSSILRARDEKKIKGIYGSAAELFDAKEKKYELAIELAAGSRLWSIIVEDDEVASSAIKYLKDNGLGRATFLPLNRMILGKPRKKALIAAKERGACGLAMDLINFDEKHRKAFWYVFGDTVIVDNLDTARKLMGGVRLVTLDGEIIDPSGAMIGGSIDRSGSGTIGKLRRAISHRNELSDKLIEIRNELSKIEREIASNKYANLEFKEIKTKLDIMRKKIEEKKGELNQKEKIAKEMEKEAKEYERKIEELDKSIADKKIIGQANEKIRSMEERITIIKKEKGEMEVKEGAIKVTIEIIKDRENEILDRLKKMAEMDGYYSMKELKKKKEKCDEELKSLMEVAKKFSEEFGSLSKRKEELYREMVKIDSDLEKKSVKIETLSDLISRANYRLPLLEEELKEIDVEVGDVKPIIEKESIAFLKEKAREIEEKMERMQPVNMRAMEEYDRQRGRKKKFDEEIDRLRNQRSELMNLVEQIEKKKKRIFNEAFDSINENFCQIYKNLSNGSEAKLGLENESNPFEGGLIIEVKPKGERGMRLEALSGGEKSLASLAFIFAIQEYQPSPFYVLDEVDMFLDGLNAEKIAKMIKENSRMAQFIMISLKKIALREADHVYGVTIEEGVSNIIGKVNV